MTRDEFQNRYAEYMVKDRAAAEAECAKVNEIGIDGNSAVAVKFAGWWCLMLKTAYDFVAGLGIESEEK